MNASVSMRIGCYLFMLNNFPFKGLVYEYEESEKILLLIDAAMNFFKTVDTPEKFQSFNKKLPKTLKENMLMYPEIRKLCKEDNFEK